MPGPVITGGSTGLIQGGSTLLRQ